MIEIRWAVPKNETFVPNRDWPKLQYRQLKPSVDASGALCPSVEWTDWQDVQTVAVDPPNTKLTWSQRDD